MATKTTDHAGTTIAEGDFVRYHGSKAARCPVAVFKVAKVFPNGRMHLVDDGAFPVRLSGVRPASVTFDC